MDELVIHALEPLLGLPCCRLRVGRARSLSLGFGAKLPHGKPDMADAFYGEWELGSYCGTWRFVQAGRVVCGSQEAADSIQELDDSVREAVQPGRILEVRMLSPLDVRVVLDNMVVDFLASSSDSDGDELFHVFGPESLYIEYRPPDVWTVGRSDVPWK
jgi:hypothetical protein